MAVEYRDQKLTPAVDVLFTKLAGSSFKGIFQSIAIKDLNQGSPKISTEVYIYAEFRVENEYQLYFPTRPHLPA